MAPLLTMFLSLYIDAYASTRPIKPATVDSYRHAVKSLDKSQHKPVQLGQLSADMLNRYLVSQISDGFSLHTIKSRRNELCTLWRAASDEGLAPPYKRPTAIRAPRKVISAVPRDEVSRLVMAAANLPGCIHRSLIPRGLYWSCFVAVAYETALRTSDILQLRYKPEGRWVLVQVKTNKPVGVDVSGATLDALRHLSRASTGLLKLDRAKDWYCRGFRKVAELAGMYATPQTMRQSAASEIESIRPNTAWMALGHDSPATTLGWYIDRAHAYANIPRPRVDWK